MYLKLKAILSGVKNHIVMNMYLTLKKSLGSCTLINNDDNSESISIFIHIIIIYVVDIRNMNLTNLLLSKDSKYKFCAILILKFMDDQTEVILFPIAVF